MFKFRRRKNDYEQLARSSLDLTATGDAFNRSSADFEPFDDIEDAYPNVTPARSSVLSNLAWPLLATLRSCRAAGRGGRWRRILVRCVWTAVFVLVVLLVITPIWNPSYSKRPPHYTGTNPRNESVFIAANIVDEELIRGAWGDALVRLIDRIGPQNVFLSVYENDSGPATKEALEALALRVKCESAIVSGHIDLDSFPSIQILPDEHRVKRIAYLSEVRNQALHPLDMLEAENTTELGATAGTRKFDKLLFLNDVVFEPKDAADLLFATNVGGDGRTQYEAACAMDFINAFKFYDTFATRDNEAQRAGIPFFPWFTRAGRAESWHDVLKGTDAVRVKSCWGGMVAFEAKWFQAQGLREGLQPLRFRYEQDLFWDASECCLIHADLDVLVRETDNTPLRTGIFINPFIRVAYDSNSLSWLEFTRKFERLYIVPQTIVNWVIAAPWPSLRRLEVTGETVERKEWVYEPPTEDAPADGIDLSEVTNFGHWENVRKVATPGGFCGYQTLQVLRKERKPGQKMWEIIEAPPGGN